MAQPITQAAPGADQVAEFFRIGAESSSGATVHMTAPNTEEALATMGWNVIGSQAGTETLQEFLGAVLGDPGTVSEGGPHAQLHREAPFPWPAPPHGPGSP